MFTTGVRNHGNERWLLPAISELNVKTDENPGLLLAEILIAITVLLVQWLTACIPASRTLWQQAFIFRKQHRDLPRDILPPHKGQMSLEDCRINVHSWRGQAFHILLLFTD